MNNDTHIVNLDDTEYKIPVEGEDVCSDSTFAEETIKNFGAGVVVKMNMKKIEEREYFQKLNRK